MNLGFFCFLLIPFFFLLQLLNLRRDSRDRQAVLPLLALLYALIMGSLSQTLNRLIRHLLLGVVPVQWYARIGPDLAAMLLGNLAVTLGFLIIKILFRILRRKKIPEKPYQGILGKFARRYYSRPETTFCQARPHALLAVRYFTLALILMGGMLTLYILCALYIPGQLPVRIPWGYLSFWPAALFLVLLEARWFLNGGVSVREYSNERNRNKGDGIKQYVADFPEWLAVNRQTRIEDGDGTSQEYTPSRIVRIIIRRMEKTGLDYNQQVARCIERISTEKSILIDGNLMSTLGIAILYYMDLMLARGENFLILCTDDQAAEEYTVYIKARLNKIHYAGSLWTVRGPSEAQSSGDCDVLILTAEEILSMRMGTANALFSKDLKHFLVLDTAEILGQQPDLITTAIRMLNSSHRDLNFIFLCCGIPLQLPSSLERILNCPSGMLDVVYMGNGMRDYDVYIWNTENRKSSLIPQEKLINKQLDNTNLSLPFSLAVDVFRQGELPLYICSDTLPLHQAIRSGQNAPALRLLLGGNEKQNAFFRELTVNHENSASVIWEDAQCNLPYTLRNAFSFARDHGIIHIISRPYLLREFFISRFANESYNLINERSYFNALTSSFTDTPYTASINILMEAASREGIDRKRLILLASGFLPREKLTIRNILYWCRNNLIGYMATNPLEQDFEIREEAPFLHNQFVRQPYIHLINHRLLDHPVSGSMKRAMLRIQALTDITEHMLWFGADSIDQRYLVNQGILYNHTLYTIQHIDHGKGIISAVQAEESLKTAPDYVQTRIYDPQDLRQETAPISGLNQISSSVALLQVHAWTCSKMQVYTTGYFAISHDLPSPVLFDKNTPYHSFDQNRAPRILSNARFFILSIYHPDNSRNRITCLLSVLLNELFKTFFPYDWQCISACPLLTEASREETEFTQDWSILSSYYPSLQLNSTEIAAKEYAQVAIIEDNINANGRHLNALLGDPQRPFEKPLSVLHDYLIWANEDSSRLEYLKYGKSTLPACFDIDNLISTLNNLSGYVIR